MDENDLNTFHLIIHGIPRRLYNKSEYFNTFDPQIFFSGFRMTKDTALKVLAQIKVNKLETIKGNVFNDLPLSTLDLSFNQISHINQEAFDNMPELYHINLAYNLLSVWNPQWFKNTPKLSVFYFKNNFIEELKSHSFKNLRKDRLLKLDLIFTQNRISNIDTEAFSDLRQITLLSLSNNLLTSFDKNILKNVQVNDLRLNNNSIACFDDDLDYTFKARYNYIEYNPLECGCLKRIKKWSETNNKDVGIADTNCQEDEEKLQDVVEIEDVREVAKDIYAIQHITLILPTRSKADTQTNA